MPAVKLTLLNKELARSPNSYREWRKEIDIIQTLYKVSPADLGPLVYMSLEKGEGQPRELVETLELDVLNSAEGLKQLLEILDGEFVEKDYERSEKYLRAFEKCRRAVGENIDEYIARLKTARRNLKVHDPGTTYSDTSFARKLLRSAGLSKDQQRQVLASAGAEWNSTKIEATIKMVYGDVHLDEKRRDDRRGTHMNKPAQFRQFPPRFGQSNSKFTPEGNAKGKPPGAAGGGKGWFRRPPWQANYAGGGEADEEFSQDEDYPEEENDDEQQEALGPGDGQEGYQEEECEICEDSDVMDEQEEGVLDAFYQGFKAKKRQFGRGKGKGKGAGAASGGKKSGKCNDCGLPGHWKGDPECPKVIAGVTAPFKAGGKGDTSKRSASSANVAATVATHGDEHTEFLWLGEENPILPTPKPGPIDALVLGSKPKKAQKESEPEESEENEEEVRPPTPSSDFEDEHGDPGFWGLFRGWSNAQLSAELARRKHKSTGTRAEMLDRLYRSNLQPTMEADGDGAADGWERVPEARARPARDRPSGSSNSGARPKPTACPNPKGKAKARAAEPTNSPPRSRVRVTGEDIEEFVKKFRAHQDAYIVDFFNRCKEPDMGYVTDCEFEVLKIMTNEQLEDVLLVLEQAFSGNKQEKIDRLVAFVADQADNPCDHRGTSGTETENVRWAGSATWVWATCKNCQRSVQRIPRSNAAKDRIDKSKRRFKWHETQDALVVNDVLWDDIGTTELINDSGCRRSVAGHEWHDNLQEYLKGLGLRPVKKDIDEEFRFGSGDLATATESYVYPAGINGKHGVIEVARVEGRTPPLLSQQAMQDLGLVVNYSKKIMDIEAAGVKQKPIKQSRSGHFLVDIGEYGDVDEFPECFRIDKNWDDRITDPPDDDTLELGFQDMTRMGVLQRGRKKRLQRASKGVADALTSESRRAEYKEPTNKTASRAPRSHLWKFMEIFSWTLVLSREAASQGWQVAPSISLETGYDLYTKSGRMRAWKQFITEKPDAVAVAWPCDPWTAMNNYQANRPDFQEKLKIRQEQSRGALRFVKRVADYQRRHGALFFGENPLTSAAFKEPPIVEIMQTHGTTVVDMCAFGLQHPDSHLPIRKPSRIITSTQSMADQLERRCPGHPHHAKIEGRIKSKGMSVSKFAGGYTQDFAKAVLQVFITELETRRSVDVLANDAKRRRVTIPLKRSLPHDQPPITEKRVRVNPTPLPFSVDTTEREQVQPVKLRSGKMKKVRAQAFSQGGASQLGRSISFQQKHYLTKLAPGWHGSGNVMVHVGQGNVQLWSSDYPEHTLRSVYAVRRTTDRGGKKWTCEELDVPVNPEGPEVSVQKELLKVVTILKKPQRQTQETRRNQEEQLPDEATEATEATEEAQEQHHSVPEEQPEEARSDGEQEGPEGSTPTPIPELPEEAETVRDPLYPEDIPAGEMFTTTTGQQEVSHVPPEVRTEVRRAHRNLGHCGRDALLRVMRLGGASQLHLDYAKVWQCEVCARRAAPGRRRVVSSRQRPTSFGTVVGVDTKELKDVNGDKYLALNCVDFATKFSCLILLGNPSSAEAAKMFMTKWCNWAGVPLLCHSDNGSEFRKDFTSYAESVGITMRVVPTESPWQHGLVERHGAVSNDIIRAIVDECSVQGPAEMELAIVAANLCKNRRPDPSGYSPRMRVFGCGDRLPGSVLDSLLSDEQYPEIAVHDAVLKDFQMQKSQKIREAAQVALAKLDNSEKWRKAIVHNYRPTPSPWMPGECVFFWRAAGTFKPQARSTRRADRWHGPAVILGREWGREGQNEAYWLVFNGNLLLVAPQHIRSATPEERLASEAIGSILENYNMDLTGIVRGQHTFEDLRPVTGENPPMPPTSVEVQAPATSAQPEMPRQSSEPEAQPSPAASERAPTPQPQIEEVVSPVPYHNNNTTIDPMAADIPGPVAAASVPQAVDIPVPDLEVDALYVMNDAFSLELRPFQAGTKGKELDSRKFTKEEWVGFNKSIAKNWHQHLQHEAVRVVLPDEAQKVDPSRIFKSPARFVHTIKEQEPNSRFIIPGHLDPDGQDKTSFKQAKRLVTSAEAAGARTDAPVAPMVGLMLILNLAAHFGWNIGTFDIGSAFLTGKTNTRRLFVWPPREGLPGVPEGSLIELLKGVFGLRESPRLWWERFSEVLIQAGFTPLKTMKGVFVIRGESGHIEAALCVHVDDGLWGGTGERFEAAKRIVRQKLNVTKEKNGTFEFLGRRINQLENKSIEVDQHTYIDKMEKIFVPASRRKDPEAKTTEEELSKYRSLGQQLSWAARTTLPGLAYDVSDLQQRTPDLTVGQLCKANTVLNMAKDMVKRDVKMRFHRGDGSGRFGCLCVHDASYDRQPRSGSQQGFLLLLTDEKFKAKVVNVVDWCSSKIHRVVRSTLAAESASASYGFDRACFVRTALAEMLYGWESQDNWTALMDKIPNLCVTDCKSFVDLCRKEGSMPTERRIALDLADLRDRLEAGDGLIWTDTRLMLADPLTKHMKDQSYLEHVLKTGEYVYRCKHETKAENRGEKR